MECRKRRAFTYFGILFSKWLTEEIKDTIMLIVKDTLVPLEKEPDGDCDEYNIGYQGHYMKSADECNSMEKQYDKI